MVLSFAQGNDDEVLPVVGIEGSIGVEMAIEALSSHLSQVHMWQGVKIPM